jgi:methionine synthase II (cobalamin-independent)
MEVNAQRAELVAAEETIHVVNWSFDDRQLTTELMDVDGDPLDFGSLRQGQWILVKGFRHIEGGVIASLIQRIEPPERSKPLVREISKVSRRNKLIQRHLKDRNQ